MAVNLGTQLKLQVGCISFRREVETEICDVQKLVMSSYELSWTNFVSSYQLN